MPQVYEIFVQDHFSAAHSLKGYNGNCSKIHGHNWIVEVYIRCGKLNRLGIAIDFRDVRDTLKKILDKLDHTDLNEIAEFGSINPTSENIAKLLFSELARHFNAEHVTVSMVKVFESPGCGASYWEE